MKLIEEDLREAADDAHMGNCDRVARQGGATRVRSPIAPRAQLSSRCFDYQR